MLAPALIVVGYVGILVTLGWRGLALGALHLGVLALAAAIERKDR